MITHITTNRKTAYNSTFAIGRVLRSEDSFVVIESAVLRMNICPENLLLAKRQNVMRSLYRPSVQTSKN